ncbi:MAG: sugar phosphate nucleotidyltransferase [Planctomycetota bacterium]
MSELRGVILSAGKGSRIDPFNTRFPKPLLPIANRPILGHHLEILKGLGVRRVSMVVGHLMDKIIGHFGRGDALGLEIDYVEQRATLGIAHALAQLPPSVEGPVMVVLGDIFYVPRGLDAMVEQFRAQGESGAVLAVMREPDHAVLKKNFSVELDAAGRATRVIEKPALPPNDLKGCGIYLFGPEIFDAVRKTPRTALRDEYEITSSIQILIDDGFPVTISECIDWDFNVTFAEDLLEGNLRYLDSHGLSSMIAEDAEIHPDAVVERSVIGPGVRVRTPVRIRDSVLLADTEIARDQDLERVIASPDIWYPCR